jgi:nicotinate-nucleotide adenylyltransferase
MMLQRVGLMGGSFDPVHVAHVQLAHTALHALNLDQVRWIPAGQPWQKRRQLAQPQHRLAMVRLATAHEPRFVIDSLEIDRPGPSYTLDTVLALQAQHPQVQTWYLILGQDQYAHFHTWHGWEALLQRLTLAVACRGTALPSPPPPSKLCRTAWKCWPCHPLRCHLPTFGNVWAKGRRQTL